MSSEREAVGDDQWIERIEDLILERVRGNPGHTPDIYGEEAAAEIIYELIVKPLKATIERLQSESAKDGEALRPLASLYERFAGHVVVEVCEPHPDNPSPEIEPLMVMDLFNARARLSARKATPPAGSTQIGEG